MASIRRLAQTIRCLRTTTSAKTISPSSPLALAERIIPPPMMCNGELEGQTQTEPKGFNKLPVYLALAAGGFLGFGRLHAASFSDVNEAASETAPPAESATEAVKSPPESHSDSSHTKIPERVKAQIEELLRNKGCETGSYPPFTVKFIGQRVIVNFNVPVETEEYRSAGPHMELGTMISKAAWHLILRCPKTRKEETSEDSNEDDGKFFIQIFHPVNGSPNNVNFQFWKQGSFTSEQLDALATVLQIAGQPNNSEIRPREDVSLTKIQKAISILEGQPNNSELRPREDASHTKFQKTISSLESMGVKIYGLKQPNVEHPRDNISWDNIAGYDNQKRDIENTILLALKHPQVYDDIARGTRCKFESNKPRAVLFEGPPGTGKTSCARVISSQAGVPLLYVPLQSISSPYFGENERLLGKVFSLAREFPGGAIIFLDEVDAIAVARNPKVHEGTKRILSVLLNQIDGFEQEKKVVVIAATNAKNDVDPALISRFEVMISFDLPDQQTREAIIAEYAKHLTRSELAQLASATEEMSGRDIKNVCQQAERYWASKIISQQGKNVEEQSLLPPLDEYFESARKRKKAIADSANKRDLNPKFDFI